MKGEGEKIVNEVDNQKAIMEFKHSRWCTL